MNRPSREQLHMETAIRWASRSTCKRSDGQVAAVITNDDMTEIITFGYNGPARGLSHDRCRNTPGSCGCVHAECNAIARLKSYRGHTMFVTTAPCELCAQLILNSDIARVYYLRQYRESIGIDLLSGAGLDVRLMEIPNPLLPPHQP